MANNQSRWLVEVSQGVEPVLLLHGKACANQACWALGEGLDVLVLYEKSAGGTGVESIRHSASVRVMDLPPEELRWKMPVHGSYEAMLSHA